MAKSAETAIIGIDCATDPRRVGLALGRYTPGGVVIEELATGEQGRPVGERVCDWIREDTRVLLALDAPLGWPAPLGKLVHAHAAGDAVDVSPNCLFRRETDRFIKQWVGKQPLDVGADRIARTACAALGILEMVRQCTGGGVPLAWTADFCERVAAIEVYPAATLIGYGLPSTAYKKASDRAVRSAIVDGLTQHWSVGCDPALLLGNADVLDAALCVLAGSDFLLGQTMPPEDAGLARKEGWIWSRQPGRS